MGYVLTTLPTQYVKKAVAETTEWIHILGVDAANGVYTVFYKRTIDVTNLDYIVLNLDLANLFDVYLRVKLDTTTVDNSSYAKNDTHLAKIDVTAYTGEKVVELACAGDGGNGRINEASFWSLES